MGETTVYRPRNIRKHFVNEEEDEIERIKKYVHRRMEEDRPIEERRSDKVKKFADLHGISIKPTSKISERPVANKNSVLRESEPVYSKCRTCK